MRKWVFAAALLPLALAAGQASKPRESGTTFIGNVVIVDGTRAKGYRGAVRIAGDRIVCVGACALSPGDRQLDGQGQVLAPGFIDSHSHHDEGLENDLLAPVVVRQGITTIVVGQDGFSAVPLSGLFKQYQRTPAAINIAAYVGHNSVREAAMGKDNKRPATPRELARMRSLVGRAMKDGALGLSSGLEYESGLYSTREEVLALAGVAARHGGRYISHIRSEDVRLDDAIDEVIAIGRATGMPVQISHLKIALLDRWGDAAKVLARLDRARAEGIAVTADVYPYAWWHSSLDVVLPKRDFTDLAEARFALTHLAKPEDMILSDFPPDPSLVGKSVAQIAAQRGGDVAEVFLALNREAAAKGQGSGVMARSMADEDIAAFLAWPHSAICSDGQLAGRHPRGAGSFPRIFAWLVRGSRVLGLEEAVFKMTGLAAQQLGIRDRGEIAVGKAADLVLFDPATIADRATFADPLAAPVGISAVWVNGVQVLADGQPTGKRPGKVLKR